MLAVTIILQKRYKILSLLGNGGYGTTFLATDWQQSDNSRCVVKQLQPQFTDPEHLALARRLFQTEAKVLKKLGGHPQIPQLFDYFEEAQEFYLVQEYIKGQSLNTELIPGKQFSEADVIALLKDILETLAFVHQQNVIHRDIKPSNLIRRQSDNRIVLIDFGAVKQVSTQTISPHGKTQFTVAIGTPGYLPSEQANGKPKFNSDIYAVGMIGIAALTGLDPTRQKFPEDSSTGEIRWHHWANVSWEFAKILDNMVRYDYRQRYQSAEAVLSDLNKLQHSTNASFPGRFPVTEATVALKPAESLPLSHQFSQALDWIKFTVQQKSVQTKIAIAGLAILATPLAVSWLSPTPKSTAKTPEGNSAVEWLNEGDRLREAEQYIVSLTAYEQALQLEPNLKSAWWGRCYGLNAVQQYEEALNACEQALQLDSNYPEALNSRGYALNALKRYSEAIATYQQALQIQPNYLEAWVNQGAALYNLGQYQDALAAYNRALQIQPGYPEAWNNKGATLAKLNNDLGALEAYNKATQLKPDYPEAWNNRGVLLNKLQRYEEAKTSYEKAIQLRPDYSVAKQNLQKTLYLLK